MRFVKASVSVYRTLSTEYGNNEVPWWAYPITWIIQNCTFFNEKKKEYLDDWCFCISFNEKISCFQEFLDEGCSTVIQYQKSNFEITFRKYFSSR